MGAFKKIVFLRGISFSLGRAYVWLKFKSITPWGHTHTHTSDCSKCLYIVTYYHFQMPKHYKCTICGKYRLKHRRPIRTQSLKEYVEKTIGRSTNEDDVICSKCRSVYKRYVRDSHNETHETEGSDDDFVVVDSAACTNDMISPKNIHLNILSTQSSHKYCIVCKKQANSRVKLSVIPLKARTQAFIDKAIFIDSKARCCPFHLLHQYFKEDSLNQIKAKYNQSYMNRTDIVTLLQNVRATLSQKSSRLSFDHPNCLSDEDYYSLTGVTKHQFSQISSRLSSLRNSSVRSVESCLGILLVKLRTGLPNSILSTLFSLTKSQIQRSIKFRQKRNAVRLRTTPFGLQSH